MSSSSPEISKNKEDPPRVKQDPSMGIGDKKSNEKLDLEKPSNPVDKKTARWIEDQNEFMGKKENKGLMGKEKKEKCPPSVPITQLRSYNDQSQSTILTMSDHPNTQWELKGGKSHNYL